MSMDPWETKEWAFGTQQHLPEIARMNRRLHLLSIALVVAGGVGAALALIFLALEGRLQVPDVGVVPFLFCFGLAYARICHRRSLDLETDLFPFGSLRIGREQSRAERSVNDHGFFYVGIVVALGLVALPSLLLARVLGMVH